MSVSEPCPLQPPHAGVGLGLCDFPVPHRTHLGRLSLFLPGAQALESGCVMGCRRGGSVRACDRDSLSPVHSLSAPW